MSALKKMQVVLLSLVVPALLILIAGPCTAAEPGGQAAAQAVNAFALDLYGQLRTSEGNLFFSPYSVSVALAMTYAGARGKTESQMAKASHFSLGQSKTNEAFRFLNEELRAAGKKGSAELNIANALWADKSYTFRKEFLDSVRINYGGGLRQLDFRGASEAARNTINKWVKDQTNDKIKDLVGPGMIGADTRLVLTNAIYFKGLWESQFDKKRTKEEPFTTSAGEEIRVPMMHDTRSFAYAEADGLQILEMPYKGRELSMVVLLPEKQRSFEEFEQSLTVDNLDRWVDQLGSQKVKVYIPRFKMSSSFQLRSALTALAMTDAFSPADADFSGMTGDRDLFIGAVIHKAFVEVNEKGTEAAAATAVTMPMAGAPRPIPVFRADHPFVFLVRHVPSNCILFLGRVTKP